MSDDVKEAIWAETTPDSDGEGRWWRVGQYFPLGPDNSRVMVTRITVQTDEPGMYCNMRRVCVWVGDTMVAEAPAHICAIGYALPEATE